MPFDKLLEKHQPSLTNSYTTLREPSDLRRTLEGALSTGGIIDGIFGRQFITTCGSGMTAAIIWLALQQIGVNSSLYDEVCSKVPKQVAIELTSHSLLVVDGICSSRFIQN